MERENVLSCAFTAVYPLSKALLEKTVRCATVSAASKVEAPQSGTKGLLVVRIVTVRGRACIVDRPCCWFLQAHYYLLATGVGSSTQCLRTDVHGSEAWGHPRLV